MPPLLTIIYAMLRCLRVAGLYADAIARCLRAISLTPLTPLATLARFTRLMLRLRHTRDDATNDVRRCHAY